MSAHQKSSPFSIRTKADPKKILEFPEQIERGLKAEFPPKKSKGVCIFAVGPTSAAAQFVVDVSNRYPFCVLSSLDERIPGWVGRGNDAILMSYSGNTEKIVNAYGCLEKRACDIHCMTSDGILSEKCKERGDDFIQLPLGMTPRSAVGLEIGLLASLLKSFGAPYLHDALSAILDDLKAYRDNLIKDPSEVNRVADTLEDKIPAIYSIVDIVAAAKRWKLSFDEDTDAPAFYGEIPEFDHNEIVGWADPNIHARNLEMVLLRIDSGIPELEYVLKSMMEVLDEYDRKIVCVDFPEKNMTLAELEAMLFGDMVSLEIRKRRGVQRWERKQ